jgi:lipopolysaccharide/colanic/teichoic acid biosynthesis glycosyltransferase
MVKPGITGLGQVHGRYDTTIENKLRYDLVYINNMSPLLDLKILVLTIRSILTWKDKI